MSAPVLDFTDKVEHSGRILLEDAVMASREKPLAGTVISPAPRSTVT